MPLMMCPNCQTEMKEISRQGVMIDMCAQCHGIWLDRGELNKLLEVSRQDLNEAYAPPPPSVPRQAPQAHYDEGRYTSSSESYYKHRKKSKLESIFDIFD